MNGIRSIQRDEMTADPFAWFIGFDAYRLAVSADDVIVDFRACHGDRFEQRALDLGLSR